MEWKRKNRNGNERLTVCSDLWKFAQTISFLYSPISENLSALDSLTASFRKSSSGRGGEELLPSLCLSVRMEQAGSHWTDFHEI